MSPTVRHVGLRLLPRQCLRAVPHFPSDQSRYPRGCSLQGCIDCRPLARAHRTWPLLAILSRHYPSAMPAGPNARMNGYVWGQDSLLQLLSLSLYLHHSKLPNRGYRSPKAHSYGKVHRIDESKSPGPSSADIQYPAPHERCHLGVARLAKNCTGVRAQRQGDRRGINQPIKG